MYLYTLCLEGTPIAICAFDTNERDSKRTVRDALFETWQFGGGDLKQLVGRAIDARPPTREEGDMWIEAASEFGKPFLVLAGAGGSLIDVH